MHHVMYSNALNRPMTIAISGSIAIHVLLGLYALWVIGSALQPSVTERLLVIKLQPTQRDDAATNQAAADAATARTATTRQARTVDQSGLQNRRPAPARVSNQRIEIARTELREKSSPDPQTRIQANKPPKKTPDKQIEAPGARATAIELPVPEPVITTITGDRSIAKSTADPAAEKSPAIRLNPVQQKMLAKKIQKWTRALHKSKSFASPVTWTHKGQVYEAHFTHIPAKGDTDIAKVLVEVLTRQNGQLLRTQMQMKMLAFSHFAQFVNRWDQRVQMHDDKLDGRFHSNSQINFAWDRNVRPQFLGKVTTASERVNFSDTRGYRYRDEIFVGGLETGVRSIPLVHRYFPHAATDPDGTQQVLQFTDDTHIRFYADGSLGWRKAREGGTQTRVQLTGQTVYLVGAKGKTLHVSGEVNGSILVYSPSRIVIEDDLTYAHGSTGPAAVGAFLGLVSGKTIEIAAPEVTGPGPLYVHASIYARQKFKVQDYRKRENSLLYIYGSLTAGTLSATEPRFATHIEFDKRLEEQRPPGFPVTRRYELSQWDALWQEAPRLHLSKY